MAIYEVPPPGQGTPAVATFCDQGADTVRAKTKPAGWYALSIRSIGATSPDAHGRMLYGVFKFFVPLQQQAGKRRTTIGACWPTGNTAQQSIDVAADAASGWIGTKCSLFFAGGTPGDEYEYTLTDFVPREFTKRNTERDERVVDVYEPLFCFSLTSYLVIIDQINFPTPPAYHQWFEAAAANTAQMTIPAVGVIPIVPGETGRVKLSAPQIQIVASGYFTTGGSL